MKLKRYSTKVHPYDQLLYIRGVMIPFFSGTGIITGIMEKEPESESHGIDSKVESIPRVESIPVLESDPGLESIPIKEWDLLNSKRSSQRLNFQ